MHIKYCKLQIIIIIQYWVIFSPTLNLRHLSHFWWHFWPHSFLPHQLNQSTRLLLVECVRCLAH